MKLLFTGEGLYLFELLMCCITEVGKTVVSLEGSCLAAYLEALLMFNYIALCIVIGSCFCV